MMPSGTSGRKTARHRRPGEHTARESRKELEHHEDPHQGRDRRDRDRDDEGRRRDRRREGVRDRRGDARPGRRRDRRDRPVRDAGRRRRPHPHGPAVRRQLLLGRLRDRDARGRVRRDDDDRGLRVAGLRRGTATGSRPLAREGEEGDHRLRVPHDHPRGERPGPEGDGRARGRGRDLVQALHGVPGRVHARRRVDLPRDAAGWRLRRAHHDARGERRPDRRPRAAVPRRGQDRAAQPRPHAAGDDGRGGRPPRVQARRARRTRPRTSCTSPRATR